MFESIRTYFSHTFFCGKKSQREMDKFSYENEIYVNKKKDLKKLQPNCLENIRKVSLNEMNLSKTNTNKLFIDEDKFSSFRKSLAKKNKYTNNKDNTKSKELLLINYDSNESITDSTYNNSINDYYFNEENYDEFFFNINDYCATKKDNSNFPLMKKENFAKLMK